MERMTIITIEEANQLSIRTGIPVGDFKYHIVEDLKKVTGISVIREIHDETPEESPRSKASFERWDEISLKEVKDTHTSEETIEAIRRAPYSGKAVDVGWEKVRTLFLKEIEDGDTARKMWHIYARIPEKLDKIKDTASKKWEELSQKEIEDANTIEETQYAINGAPYGNVQKNGEKKLDNLLSEKVEMATTIKKTTDVYLNELHFKGKHRKTALENIIRMYKEESE